MATYTPPPYFPQGALAPPDKKRYRKFKLVIVLICLILLVSLGIVSLGIWFLVRSIF